MAGTAGTGCVEPHPDFGFPRSIFTTASHAGWPWGNLGSYLPFTHKKKMNEDGSKTRSPYLL